MVMKKDSSKKSLKNKFRSSAVIADESTTPDFAEIEEDYRAKKSAGKSPFEEAKKDEVAQRIDAGSEVQREKDIDEIIQQHIDEEGNG